MILKIMVIQFWVTLKISEIIDSNLSDQTKYSLNEINKIKDYFKSEIQEKKTMSKEPSKYIAAFAYIDKTFIDLSTTSPRVSYISSASVTGAHV